jgi:hypothetical protein
VGIVGAIGLGKFAFDIGNVLKERAGRRQQLNAAAPWNENRQKQADDLWTFHQPKT